MSPAEAEPETPGAGTGRRLDPDSLGSHLERLYRAAYGLCGSRPDAEDLVQDTYERVLRRPRFLRRDDDLGYLLRVLRNTWVSGTAPKGRRPWCRRATRSRRSAGPTIRSLSAWWERPSTRRCRG